MENSSVHVVEVDEEGEANASSSESNDVFITKTGNEWMEVAKLNPVPKMLFDEFWFENEICVLFADTNVGKSILAVQIADSISTGNPIPGFAMEANKQKVLYFDFELNSKQFENRYSKEFQNHYEWDENFMRVELNSDMVIPEKLSFEEYISKGIEQEVVNKGVKVLIIDNITYLKSDTSQAKDATVLMQNLKRLKIKYGLSILILAHTPKRKEFYPITINDLAGSSALGNFVDSAFAIGKSKDGKEFKYLKQVKVRQMEYKYDYDNVVICKVEKPDNFLKFRLLAYSPEKEHLNIVKSKDDETAEMIKLKSSGMKNTEIAELFDLSEGAIRKRLSKVKED